MTVLVFTLVAHDGNLLVSKRGTCVDDGDLCLCVGVNLYVVNDDLVAAELNAAVDTEADLLAVEELESGIVVIDAVENEYVRSVIENALCTLEG